MAVSVVVPGFGSGDVRSVLAAWYHADGGAVHRGEFVCAVEADHVAVDVEADEDGVLWHQRQGGSELERGETLAYILAIGERLPERDRVLGAPLAVAGEPWQPAEAGEAADAPTHWESEAAASSPGPGEAAEESPNGNAAEPPRLSARALAPQAATLARRGLPRAPAWLEEPDALAEVAGVLDDVDAPAAIDGLTNEQPAPGAPPTDWFDDDSLAARNHPARGRSRLSALPRLENAGQQAPPSPWPGEAPAFDTTAAGDEPSGEDAAPGHAALPDPRAPVVVEASHRVMRVEVDLCEVNRMCAQLRQEWLDASVEPSLDDVVLRAAARALRVHRALAAFPESVTLDVLDERGPCPVDDVADAPFRAAVERRQRAEPGNGSSVATCAVTSLAALRIDDSVPAVAPGQALALCVGAPRRADSQNGRDNANEAATLTLAWDASLVSEAVAAHYLRRVRALIESPYALLAG